MVSIVQLVERKFTLIAMTRSSVNWREQGGFQGTSSLASTLVSRWGEECESTYSGTDHLAFSFWKDWRWAQNHGMLL